MNRNTETFQGNDYIHLIVMLSRVSQYIKMYQIIHMYNLLYVNYCAVSH
jgi:hypothetical protein